MEASGPSLGSFLVLGIATGVLITAVIEGFLMLVDWIFFR